MGLFVKNNYKLFILPLFIWAFSSCSSSENTVEILEETQQFEVENTKVSNGWVQIGNQKFEMAFTCYKTKLGEVAAIGYGEDSKTKESAERSAGPAAAQHRCPAAHSHDARPHHPVGLAL